MGLREFLCLVMIAMSSADLADPMMLLNEEVDKTSMNSAPSIRLSTTLTETIVKGGESFELKCEAVGSPPPVFSWLKDGKPIVGSQDNNLFEKLRNLGKDTVETAVTISKIKIPCAEKRHRGKYTCVVSNGYATHHSVARVSVVGSSSCNKVVHPPQIVQHTESRFENSGNSVQLFCRPAGASQISWFGPERELLNNVPGYEVLPNGDLMISTASWDMMGVYTCVASNNDGEARTESFLYPTTPEDDNLLL